jgi:hypothetical protein
MSHRRSATWRRHAVICLAASLACIPVSTSPIFAQNATFAQPLYGMWYTYPLGNPNTDPLRHEFRHNSKTGQDEMIVTRLCPGDYRAVIARVVSPVEVSQSSIHVLKSVSDTEKGENNSLCQVSIAAGVLGYTVSEDSARLTLTNPGRIPDMLELARQDAASEAVLPSNLYGTWLFPVQDVAAGKIQMRLVFYNSADGDRGRVRQISVCSRGNSSLVAQVDSDITIAKDLITIPEAVTREEEDGPFSCTATIAAGKLRYAVSPNGATLTLTKPGGRPMTLTREHQDIH